MGIGFRLPFDAASVEGWIKPTIKVGRPIDEYALGGVAPAVHEMPRERPAQGLTNREGQG